MRKFTRPLPLSHDSYLQGKRDAELMLGDSGPIQRMRPAARTCGDNGVSPNPAISELYKAADRRAERASAKRKEVK